MEAQICRPSRVPNREFWTHVRLTCVLVLLGLWLRWRFGIGPAWIPYLKGGFVILFFCFCLLGLLSVVFARLFVALLILPIHATIILNRWIFDGAYWSFRNILLLFYKRRVSAFIAFLCELGIFAGLWYATEQLIRRYC